MVPLRYLVAERPDFWIFTKKSLYFHIVKLAA